MQGVQCEQLERKPLFRRVALEKVCDKGWFFQPSDALSRGTIETNLPSLFNH